MVNIDAKDMAKYEQEVVTGSFRDIAADCAARFNDGWTLQNALYGESNQCLLVFVRLKKAVTARKPAKKVS